MKQLLAEPAVRVGQLEGPQEVVGCLEVGPDRVNLVNKVLHADDAGLAEGALDDRVVRDRDALLVHLREGGLQRLVANNRGQRFLVLTPTYPSLKFGTRYRYTCSDSPLFFKKPI